MEQFLIIRLNEFQDPITCKQYKSRIVKSGYFKSNPIQIVPGNISVTLFAATYGRSNPVSWHSHVIILIQLFVNQNRNGIHFTHSLTPYFTNAHTCPNVVPFWRRKKNMDIFPTKLATKQLIDWLIDCFKSS